MKDKAKEKVQNEVLNWDYLNALKKDEYGFSLTIEKLEADDVFKIFSYENKDKHLKVEGYFHEETFEYKVSTTIGLINFCNVSFFATDIAQFESHLREKLSETIKSLAEPGNENLSCLLSEKGIFEWNYAEILPEKLEGFFLFINPSAPLPTVNGSYIIFNYTDFSINTNFTLYYNIFRDEFFGESIIEGIPTVTYDFDSPTIKELEGILRQKLASHLRAIRSKKHQNQE